MDFDEINESLTDFQSNSEKISLFKQMAIHFTCKICKGVLKNTVILKECGHKFCHSCITTNLNSRNRKCPECLIKVDRLGWTFDYQYEHLKVQFYRLIDIEVPTSFMEFVLSPHSEAKQPYREQLKLKTKKSAMGRHYEKVLLCFV